MVPEIPYPNLPDVALVTWHRGPLPGSGRYYDGPIIYFNPYVCNQVGPNLSAFFRAHEYGHVELGHVKPRFFLKDIFSRGWMKQRHELEADAFATRAMISEGNLIAVHQAIQWFYGQGPIQFVPTHPPGTARALNMVATARSLGIPGL